MPYSTRSATRAVVMGSTDGDSPVVPDAVDDNPDTNAMLAVQALEARMATQFETMQTAFTRLVTELLPARSPTTGPVVADSTNATDLPAAAQSLADDDADRSISLPPSTPQPPARPTPPPQRVNTVAKPEQLTDEFSLAKFRTWRAQLDDYFMMNRFSAIPLVDQHIHLRTCISLSTRETMRLYLKLDDSHTLPISTVLDRLHSHYAEHSNITRRRVAFHECTQHAGESFAQFYVRLNQLHEQTDPCAHCCDTQLITQIISGLIDSETKRKLLVLAMPTLAEIMRICKVEEHAQRDEAALNHQHVNAIQQVTNTRPPQSRPQQPPATLPQKGNPNRPIGPPRSGGPCHSCGASTHLRHDCPFRDATCFRCGTVGHMSKVCASPDRRKPAGHTDRNIRSVHVSAVRGEDAIAPVIRVQIQLQARTFTAACLPDTGADEAVISWPILAAQGYNRSDLAPTNKRLYSANESRLRCYGTVTFHVHYCQRTVPVTAFVTPDISSFILPWFTCLDLGLLSPNYPLPCHIQKVSAPAPGLPAPANPTASDAPLLRERLLQEFSDVFCTGAQLQAMSGPPMSIHLADSYEPYAIRAPRTIPFAWRDEVKQQLDTMVAQGIIQPADDTPSEFVSPLVIVRKPTGKLRLCVDYTKLNKFVKRPIHPFKNPSDVASGIPSSSRFFTTLDATSGYWQIELEPASRPLTTFLTPYGRYVYCRAPMGLISTGDIYCQRGDAALAGLPVEKIVDDILIHSSSYADHLVLVRRVLQRCREHRITLNASKFVFGQEEVRYAGYILSNAGTRPDPSHVAAITAFPQPTNISELRSFFGLVNQLSAFSAAISSAAEPLRPLLKTRNTFVWTPEHTASFVAVKSLLSSPPVLRHFDLNLPTALHTDASRLHGLGFALMQLHGDSWHLVQCGSRFVTDTESRYAIVELEMLAIQWASQKCRLYLLGLPHFEIVTDHKPLIPILNDYTLDAIVNPRLQRLREKLQPFLFTARWLKGAHHTIPDAFSRAPVATSPNDSSTDDPEMAAHVRAIIGQNLHALDVPTDNAAADPFADASLGVLRRHATADPIYQLLRHALVTPAASPLQLKPHQPWPQALQPYKKIFAELSVQDELVLFGARIVVPTAARRLVLQRLHAPHQGVERTKRRARQIVYWPGINNDIAETVSACTECQILQPSQPKELFVADPLPSRPFESVSADLFSFSGQCYMVYADRLSGWPMVFHFGPDPTSSQVIEQMKRAFRDTGVPVLFRSDGGPQFSSLEFKNFTRDWHINHRPSSPYYPQSNGHAESAVKAMKSLIKKFSLGNTSMSDFDEAVMEWRNIPRADGLSPAQVLFGRPLRTRLPAHQLSFDPSWQQAASVTDERAAAQHEYVTTAYNATAHPLPSLTVGSAVRLQHPTSKRWDRVGIVVSARPYRQYDVRLPSGRLLTRNRRLLRLQHDQPDATTRCPTPSNNTAD